MATEGPEKGTPDSIEASYEAAEAALAKLSEGNEPDEQASEAQPESVPEPEPEEIKWVKSIDGSVNKEGEIIVDRLAKRAYESNKQAQTTAQENAQLRKMLQHPEVMAALNRIQNPQAAQPKEEKPAEENLTDEQILQKFIKQTLTSELDPLRQENALLFQKFAESQVNDTMTKLKEEFGEDEEGKPVYDSVRDEVGRRLSVVAQQSGMTLPQLTEYLIRKQALYDTLSSTARNILYPKLKERISNLQVKKVEDKKKTNLLGNKGSSAQNVKKSNDAKQINSIADALRLAEEENPDFAKLK